MTSAEAERLVTAARAGDAAAWAALVAGFERLVLAIAFGFRLGRADAEDVRQTVFFRLAQHLDRVRDPGRVGGWIATVARNECLAMVQSHKADPVAEFEDTASEGPSPEELMLRDEGAVVLWRAFELLDARCRRLLSLVVLADPKPSYEDVSAALEMPVGSIGPTRQRCLKSLRTILERTS